MRALLDVSVLIALIDSNHIFHNVAHSWWKENSLFGWASCPITENGVIRIMSNPNYSQVDQFRIDDVVKWIKIFIDESDHQFWFDDISFRDPTLFLVDQTISHHQITDLYLLALAAKEGGRVVTFDRRIRTKPILNASADDLVVLED